MYPHTYSGSSELHKRLPPLQGPKTRAKRLGHSVSMASSLEPSDVTYSECSRTIAQHVTHPSATFFFLIEKEEQGSGGAYL